MLVRFKNQWGCDLILCHRRSKHTIVGYKDDLYIFGGDNGLVKAPYFNFFLLWNDADSNVNFYNFKKEHVEWLTKVWCQRKVLGKVCADCSY